jgi:hypothetical protein
MRVGIVNGSGTHKQPACFRVFLVRRLLEITACDFHKQFPHYLRIIDCVPALVIRVMDKLGLLWCDHAPKVKIVSRTIIYLTTMTTTLHLPPNTYSLRSHFNHKKSQLLKLHLGALDKNSLKTRS